MKYKKRRFQLITRLDLAVLLGIVLAVFLSNVAAFGQECDAVRADVVRLHILANSDSPADQQVKLRVRDRILADVGGVFAGPQTQADAKEAARQNLPAIESAARAALDEAGVDAPVRAELTVDMLSYQIKKFVGSYAAALGGLDAVVFTGGIGENDHHVRKRVCADMEFLGLSIDVVANREAQGQERNISAPHSLVETWIIPTNEELLIARDTEEIVSRA